MPRKSKFPSFIDGIKNSSIKSNRASLVVNFEQIQNRLKNAFRDIPETFLNKKNLIGINENIDSLLPELRDSEFNKKYNLDYYIKVGVYLNILVGDNRETIALEPISLIIVSYLEIAKLTKDSRITDIAIKTANVIEEIKLTSMA